MLMDFSEKDYAELNDMASHLLSISLEIKQARAEQRAIEGRTAEHIGNKSKFVDSFLMNRSGYEG